MLRKSPYFEDNLNKYYNNGLFGDNDINTNNLCLDI